MEVRPLDQLLSVLRALKSSSLTPCMCQVAIIIIIITMARMKRREIISKSLAVFLYIHTTVIGMFTLAHFQTSH